MRREPPVIELLYRRYVTILRGSSAFEQKYIGSALGGGGEGGLGLRSPNIGGNLHSESLNPGEKRDLRHTPWF